MLARLILVAWALLLCAPPLKAQSRLRWSGLWYADYYYILASPERAQRGQNGFAFRRLYLTADWNARASLDGRVRLEVDDRSFTTDGRPGPFVKDLYLRFALGRHQLIAGISPTPAFEAPEEGWGYRSLERTILDFNRVASTRDFGLSVRGPLGAKGALSYWLMFGNNNGVRHEQDKFKRLYGRLAWQAQSGPVLTLYADYGRYQEDRRLWTWAGYVGYVGVLQRAGLELFAHRFERPRDPDDRLWGISLFGARRISEPIAILARADLVQRSLQGRRSRLEYAIAGVDWTIAPEVNLILNFYRTRLSPGARDSWTGRLTLHWRF
ncbi:MAG: hypothetical protein N2561_02810 [Bacteroidetes bacterium]|nr:hypothetical protein [Rhodothermia bacterium]MCX7906450.1 hypothetical protein [Bacteroidota bacterium]MDW8284862.1 hypothetical protein [Bacteroidota bacterium]